MNFNKYLLFLFLLAISFTTQSQDFTFAHVTDTHIGTETAAEDLNRTVRDLNTQKEIEFVLFTGDITEMGTDEEIAEAKSILDHLEIPYYIIPGNHDTGWSESGGVSFIKTFGSDKFVFEKHGYKFIGNASGPYVRMSDGHIPRDAIIALDSVLRTTSKKQKLILVNHYPLNESLDNWYEITERVRDYNVQFALCGHGHRNKALDFEGIPGVMGRSNLRAGDSLGGYNIIKIKDDVVSFHEKKPGETRENSWHQIYLNDSANIEQKTYTRPDYSVNDSFPNVRKIWSFHSEANVISTPAIIKNKVIFGNSTGLIEAISLNDGTSIWKFQTKGGIFSSPAAFKNSVILGSGDGNIYRINDRGEMIWKFLTEKSVLGSPIIEGDTVFIGASDGKFRAINAETGTEIWGFSGLKGPVVSTPLIHKNHIIFGAWDKSLYALQKNTGDLLWKWDNGSANRMFSPAMVIPVGIGNTIYIVAPNRFITAIDLHTGKTLYRSNEVTVRESLGVSEKQDLLYAKTMNDTLVAFKPQGENTSIAWKADLNYGYDHTPSMLYEKNNNIFFGGRNGVIFCVNSENRNILWKYKLDNSMINNIKLLGGNKVLASSMDGKVVLLEYDN
ncbi:MAG: PQQ-binding-like beta-propeller repeat protein [Christiangramia sp.]|uniref:outer membrane protein assembly factor BamB family protein n=1 Tax=Christiangramia sp. TaxID=1931228 RepID=UPI003242FCF3